MSKIKDVDKTTKEIEKIKPEKELKIEIKEKPEKREFKEYKVELKERKELKDKIEQKEFKDIEKRIEKPGKEIFEGGGFDPGTVFRAEKPEEGAAEAPKLEGFKGREIDKVKPEKEFPDKLQKEIEKIKPEKEFEKFQKELEKIKPEKEFPEKYHVKPEFEKLSIETKLDPGTRLFKGVGNPEDRIRELEDAVEKLTHFIGVDLRPDLTTGALKGEEDVGGQGGGGEAKPDDKKKPK